PGLTDILLGNGPWQDTVKTVTDMIMGEMTMDDLMINPGLDNLNIITSGSIPPNPAELINSQRFAEFMGTVEKKYDIIILDSAPVLTSADTVILGARANALLIVNRPGSVPQKILKRTSAQLKRVNCNIMGVVLNDVKSDLIPDALRKKYSQRDSVSASPAKPETAAVKEKKKNRLIRILLPLAVILLIASGILWQKGIITFPDKLFTPEADVKKSEEPRVKIQPAKKDILPEKKEEEEKIETADTVEPGREEISASAEEEIKKEVSEKDSTSGEIKPEYQEGSYPYSIYLGSYKTIERGKRAVQIYAEKEIDSFLVKVEFIKKGVWYRAYSGYYPDAESAGVFIEENKVKNAEIKKTAYACYIDSFTDNDTLENSMNHLKEKLYFPYVITDHVENVHFLLAGAFLTRTGAEELSEELRADGIENRVVSR
ncbi:MAG: SPOR domain-containing protein, partial [Desulfobacteraceae bacterium]